MHIEGDLLHDMVVTGRVEPDGEPRKEAMSQLELVDRNLCALARSFADSGFCPVMDYVVNSWDRLEAYRRLLNGYALHMAVLAPGIGSAMERKPGPAQRWAFVESMIAAELADTGLWLDTSQLGPDETVDQIFTRQRDALL